MTRLFLCAGDASGDLHAAALVEALRQHLPAARFVGLGGREMERAGVELVVHQREIAVGGLVEVLSSGRRVWRAWRAVRADLARAQPQLLILVDSPDFNLPLARWAQRRGIPVLYYIAPQVWAWRRGRIRKLAARADRLAVIFPFETGIYAGSGLPVDFVGHPLVERLRRFVAGSDRERLRKDLGVEGEAPVVTLLPGSRRNELRFGLRLQLEAAQAFRRRRPDARFLIALAPTVARADVEAAVAAAGLRANGALRIVDGRTYEAVRAADVALAKPGTVTVEVALLGCPLVVAARAHRLSAAIARRLVAVPSFTMVNLIAGGPVVPEFLQEAAQPERIARAMVDLLDGPARELQLARLAAVRAQLGSGGAAERAAEIALEMLRARARA